MRPLIAAMIVVATVAGEREAEAVTCSFGTMTGVNFGTYSTITSTDLNVDGSFNLSCTGLSSIVTVSLSGTGNGVGSITDRTMTNTTDSTYKLHYQLYTPLGALWGDGTTGVTWTVTPLLGSNTNVPVSGRVFNRQNVIVGTYNDSITVTISY